MAKFSITVTESLLGLLIRVDEIEKRQLELARRINELGQATADRFDNLNQVSE